VHERDLAEALRRQFPPPHPDVGTSLRVLLEIEPEYQHVGRGVWALQNLPVARIVAIQDLFHARLRAAACPLSEATLLESMPSEGGKALSTAFLRSCLNVDRRLCRTEDGYYGLVEWQWLLPRSLEDYVYLALRACGRPRHYACITDHVNGLVPEGHKVLPREVHAILLARTDRFFRSREGTYALLEWESAGEGEAGEPRKNRSAGTDRGRSVASCLYGDAELGRRDVSRAAS
jgi:hypothetical protein